MTASASPKARPTALPTSAAASRYRSTLERLYRLRRFGMRPGLESISALLAELGHPEKSFRAIHVTGSKGKGSISAMAARILQEAGRKVGLFTSPHLVSYRERIRVNGRPIPRAAVVEGVERIEAGRLSHSGDDGPERPATFFEVTTALAFDWFRTCQVDDAVIEVGIGGRLDSTNVIDAPVGVISTVELEHTDVLGATIPEIAREKAGILHPGMRAVVGELRPEARETIDRLASLCGVPVAHLGEGIRIADRRLFDGGQSFDLAVPQGSFRTLELPLLGRFQVGNAALAVAAVLDYAEACGFVVDEGAVRRGLSSVRWRGRLEQIGRRPETFLDVAHTPESARALAESLAEIRPLADPAQSVVLFGCLADKRYDLILDSLAPLARTAVVVPVGSSRTAKPEELRRAAAVRFPRTVQAPGARSGFALAKGAVGPEGLLIATGSDYLVGEILRSIERTADPEPDLSDPGLASMPAPANERPGRPPDREE